MAAAEDLHAPELLRYEVANALTQLVAHGALPAERLTDVWAAVSALPITYHPEMQGDETVRIALRLGRRSAYDAAYLAVAQRVGAALWTLDGPLARHATGLGFPVHIMPGNDGLSSP